MKCIKCGALVGPEAIFCQKCGAPLDKPIAGKKAAAAAADADISDAADTGPAARARRGLAGRMPADTTETAIWEGGYSPKAMIGSALVAVLITIVIIALMVVFNEIIEGYWWVPLVLIALMWAVLFLRLVIKRFDVHYRLTNQRFVHEEGILRRVTNRIEVIDVDDVAFEQGLLERMLGIGRIKIISSDRSSPELWLYGIDPVREVANLIDEARRKERTRRGLYVEAV